MTDAALADAPWLVVRFKPQSLNSCVQWFKQLGACSYCPQVETSVAHAGKVVEARRSLFPGYLFVQDVGSYDRVDLNFVSGVIGLVRRGDGRFARLAHSVIEAFRAKEVDGVIPGPEPEPVKPFRKGEALTVHLETASGLPVDVVANFVRMTARDRLVVLMALMGSTREVEVSLRQVERVTRG